MRGDKLALEHLAKVLTCELTSINQYFLHARMCKNWGLKGLNEKEYKKSILDMKQSDKLIERILMLGGIPNLQQLGKLHIGEDVQEILQCDMKLQLEHLQVSKQAIQACEQQGDFVSREILDEILTQEEDYIDWLETQLHLWDQLGSENYLQSMVND
ncbi:bacterioferritin [Neptunicella marina]|uniref:Bacterioferritin n=1 Tax=Neptunicella marina TaxID=2125989 RepID=A0A8J6IX10_9ALTE|nr:bacterioferritin [Neptunicella marina]MBC3767222.1 bacterioferritin [Neptunicella marina]